MALSGSVATSAQMGRSITLSWTATQSTENNTSTISWEIKATGSEQTYGIKVGEVSAKINGTSVYYTANYQATATHQAYSAQSGITNTAYGEILGSGTITVTHNSSGAANLTIYIGAGIYYSTGINVSNTQTFTLDSIARKSTITVPEFTLGTAGSITVNRQDNSFTHTITYAYGNSNFQSSGTICTKSSSTSVSWTPPLNFAQAIPTATKGVGSMTIKTYSGNTEIGSYSTNFYVTVPASVKPTISNLAAVIDNSANSVIAGWGLAVTGYTKIRLTATGTGAQGSSVNSYKISGGYSASPTAVSGNLDYTGAALTSAGSKTFTVKAVDSRQRESDAATTSPAITVYAYNIPVISAFTAARSASDNTKVVVRFSYEISSVNNNNAATFGLKYRLRGASTWTALADTLTADTDITLTDTYAVSNSYEFQLTVTDSVGNAASMIKTVSTQEVFLDFGAGGVKFGIGKIAEAIPTGFDGVVDINEDWALQVHGKEISDLIPTVAASAKENCLTWPYYSPDKRNYAGIVWHIQSDGTVTCTGKGNNTSTSSSFYFANNLVLPAGTYKFTGCPAGGSTTSGVENSYRVRVVYYNESTGNASAQAHDTGDGFTFTYTSPHAVTIYALVSYYVPRTTVEALVFKPMLYRYEDGIESPYIPPYGFVDSYARQRLEPLETKDGTAHVSLNIDSENGITAGSPHTIELTRTGNIVYCVFYFVGSIGTANSNIELYSAANTPLTIPSGYRPMANMNVRAWVANNASGLSGETGTIYMVDSSSYTVKIRSSVTSNRERIGSVCWLTTDDWPS